MIHDATVEVTCDAPECTESTLIQLDFGYPDYSGKGGRYKTEDSDIRDKLPGAGWSSASDQDFCEDCTEEREATIVSHDND